MKLKINALMDPIQSGEYTWFKRITSPKELDSTDIAHLAKIFNTSKHINKVYITVNGEIFYKKFVYTGGSKNWTECEGKSYCRMTYEKQKVWDVLESRFKAGKISVPIEEFEVAAEYTREDILSMFNQKNK